MVKMQTEIIYYLCTKRMKHNQNTYKTMNQNLTK